jgi:predicted AAA+ superfamily ATPase
MTSKKALQKDMEEYAEDRNDDSVASVDTITDYLDCFNRLFLLEDQPSFENKLRSSVKALKKPKRHFADPSLAVAAIGATPDMLMNDLCTFGYLFEALCVRDLRVYADYHRAQVYHYHDERENEVDAIIELEDGRWGMFEFKIGFNQVEDASRELLSIKEKFIIETKSNPSFLCVICGMSNTAYKRPDGVFVVPVTALKH